jgi:hypothetical protein
MRTNPPQLGIDPMTRMVFTILIGGSLSGIGVYCCWNWGLAPLLQMDPLPGVWRSIIRASEAIAFVVVWRATR